MGTSPADQKRFITMIGVEVDRLIDLINDILKLSELESVAIDQTEERSAVLDAAHDTASLLEPSAKAAGVTLAVEGESVTVGVPMSRLKELLFNLMGNGIKYSENGGTVTTRVRVEDGKAVISVEDHGIGIPEEDQSRVFERFYRVDKARSREPGGTGLGLSIAKEIVDRHEGTIELLDRPGPGLTVRIVLLVEGPRHGRE